MRSPACPRLATRITLLLRMYPHLDDDDFKRLVRDHDCPACPDPAWTPTRGLARDPGDDPKGSK